MSQARETTIERPNGERVVVHTDHQDAPVCAIAIRSPRSIATRMLSVCMATSKGAPK
jgi:hypothetical protein